MPSKRRKSDVNKPKPYTPTIILYALLVIGIVLIAYGFESPAIISFDGVEVSTTSLGFSIVALDVSLLLGLTALGIKAGRKGRPEYPYYDPPRIGEKSSTTIPCKSCGKKMLRSQRICPSCGYMRPPY